jgi:RNA polymerase sigma factor (sigma-70 family)
LTEHELIQNLREGNEAAFKYLVDHYQDKVYNTALGLLQNDKDAEDVAQEVFIQVFKSIKNFKEESKLSTWLYRITTGKALDLLRSKKSKKRFGLIRRLTGEGDETAIELPDFHHPGVALEKKENAAKLFRAIRQLPENQKMAFVLHKLENMSYEEISRVLHTSLPAVESLMHRAKLNLQKIIKKQPE